MRNYLHKQFPTSISFSFHDGRFDTLEKEHGRGESGMAEMKIEITGMKACGEFLNLR